MTPRHQLGLLLCAALLASNADSARIHRWVDENGKVHYGDQPPVGAERLKKPPGPADGGTPRFGADEPQPTPQVDKGVYKNASFEEICKELTARVARYRTSPNLAVSGEDGQPRALSPEERSEMISKTQSQADAACQKANN